MRPVWSGLTPPYGTIVADPPWRYRKSAQAVDTEHSRRFVSDLYDTPLSNLWLGVTVEDQAAADERIPALLRCPARVRFLSMEPLLEAVDLRRHLHGRCCVGHPDIGTTVASGSVCSRGIGWVIVGDESGPKARPFGEPEEVEHAL